MADTKQAGADNSELEFVIQRVYCKDLSFEAPNTPQIFIEQWKPEVNLELNTRNEKLEDNVFEVVLTATVTVKSQDKVAFLVEVKQSGIFTLKNFDETQLDQILSSYCPNLLFPYARETVSDLVTRGGFPQLLLSPVNFDAMYQQHLQKQEDAKQKDQ